MSEFVVDYRSSKEFESPIALSFSIEGAGSAAFLWGIVFNIQDAVLLGLLFIFAGIVVLFFHLGSPLRFWRVVTGTKRSWISRGSFLIGCLAGSGCVYYLLPFILPEYAFPPLMTALMILSAICAVCVMLYPGFLLSSMTPVPFWNTPLVPVVFLSHALTTGISLFIVVTSLSGVSTDSSIMLINGALLLVSMGLVAVHLTGMMNATVAAKRSTRLIISGKYRVIFILGGVVAGLLVPLLLTGYMYFSPSGAGIASTAILMAVFRLAGDFLYRYSVLKAGMFEPLI